MLALVEGSTFHGIIGTKTGVKVGDTEICIGDIVRVPPHKNRSEWLGVVCISGSTLCVHGIGRPISETPIEKIVKSHKCLKNGDEFFRHGVFYVRELKI